MHEAKQQAPGTILPDFRRSRQFEDARGEQPDSDQKNQLQGAGKGIEDRHDAVAPC